MNTLEFVNLTLFQNFRLVHIESTYKQPNKCDRNIAISFRKVRKDSGKRRQCWLPAFSPFPTMFSKAFFLLRH